MRVRHVASAAAVALGVLVTPAQAAGPARHAPRADASPGRPPSTAELRGWHRDIEPKAAAARAVPAAWAASTPTRRIAGPVTGPALALARYSGSGYGIYVRELAGALESAVLPASPDQAYIGEPSLSPDGTAVLFRMRRASEAVSNVYTIPVSGGSPHRLDADIANQQIYPEWTPDGATVVFTEVTSAGGTSSAGLRRVPAAGGTSTLIYGNAAHGTYSPDGSRFVYTAWSNARLLEVVAGAAPVALADYGFAPQLSRDNRHLLYTAFVQAAPHTGVQVLDIASGRAGNWLQVSGYLDADDYGAVWSADGTEIYYASAGWDATQQQATTSYDYYSVDFVDGGFRRARITTAGGYFGGGLYHGPLPSFGPGSTFHTVTPTRLLDTRNGTGTASAGPLGEGSLDLQVTGTHGAVTVPSGASAVVLNLTGVRPSRTTYLSAYPTPVGAGVAPSVSSLNVAAGGVAAIMVQVPLSGSGRVRIANAAGSTHVLADITGYFTPDSTGDTYITLTKPARVLDTRRDGTRRPLAGGAELDVPTSVVEADADATAVVVNITVVSPYIATYLSAWGSGGTRPATSVLNVDRGAVRANLATVPVGAGNRIRLRNNVASTHVLVDLVGFYVARAGHSVYHPVRPLRTLDTRYGTKTPYGAAYRLGGYAFTDVLAGDTITTAAGSVTVPSTATAVVANLVGISATAATFLSVRPTVSGDLSAPTASAVNLPRGGTVGNLTITPPGYYDLLRVYNDAGSVYLLSDLFGFYART